jgi:hypothetical protein
MAAYQLPLQASWRAVRPPKLHVDGAASHTHDGLAVCDRAQLRHTAAGAARGPFQWADGGPNQ